MDLNSLQDVYVHLLRDLYSAENQLVKALPKMAKGVSHPDLKKGFEAHLAETREQAKRIETICADLGVRPTGKKCEGMEGLISEGEDALKEKGDPASKDAAAIVDAQKIEHYEIAGYGAAVAFAQTLGYTKHARLLERTLNEEKKTDEKLNKVALKNVNLCSLEEGDEEEKPARGKSTKSKAASGKSAAAKSGAKSASASRSSKSSGPSSRSAKSATSTTSRSSSGSKSRSASSSSKGRSSGSSKKSGSSTGGNVTTDHDQIRQWVEERGGRPACVRGTGNKGDTGLLRIDYPGYSGEETLETIEWEEFFEKFDQEKLAFLHQDETADGKQSRFSKLISRSNSK